MLEEMKKKLLEAGNELMEHPDKIDEILTTIAPKKNKKINKKPIIT
jgi:hypothetical protein